MTNPVLNKVFTATSAKRAIDQRGAWLLDSEAGKTRWRLETLKNKYDRAGLEKRAARERKELSSVQAEIRAGTYTLSVSLGYRSNRNKILAMIAKKEQEIRDLQKKWAAKEYRARNPLRGDDPTNGSLERAIADQREEIADKLAEGEKAVVRVPEAGQDLSGQTCLDHLAEARSQGNAADIEHWSMRHAQWKAALSDWVEVRRERIRELQEHLVEHQRVFEAAIAAIRAKIEGRLARALAETPCAGGALVEPDPRFARVEAHRRKLRGSSETAEERTRRIDDYEDRIYVEDDGTVHGDLRSAWAFAMRDTGLRVPDNAGSGGDQLLWARTAVDWLANSYQLGGAAKELRDAHAVLDGFVQAIEGLDPSAPDFFKQRRALRGGFLDRVQKLLDSGILAEDRISDLLAALEKAGGTSKRVQEARTRLQKLRSLTMGLGREFLPRLAAALGAGAELPAEDAQRFRNMTRASARQIFGSLVEKGAGLRFQASPAWSQMSRLDRGLLSLSIANTAADVVTRTSAGMPVGEAITRGVVDLTVELAIAGLPITAAAEIGSQVLFNGYALVTGDASHTERTLSATAKRGAQTALDYLASGSAHLGHGWQVMTRNLAGEPGIAETLAGVDRGRLQRSLAQVEDRLDATAPGAPEEAQLMRMRLVFRQLLRAQAKTR